MGVAALVLKIQLLIIFKFVFKDQDENHRWTQEHQLFRIMLLTLLLYNYGQLTQFNRLVIQKAEAAKKITLLLNESNS